HLRDRLGICVGGAIPVIPDDPNLLDWLEGDRDGVTYEPEFDYDRLNRQARMVWEIIRDGRWYTLDELHRLTEQPTPSISARLRDLRKERFGNHVIERQRVSGSRGLFRYRLVPRKAL